MNLSRLGRDGGRARLRLLLLRPTRLMVLGVVIACARGSAVDTGFKPELVLQAGHAQNTTAVAFSADGRLLASGSVDGRIILWDAKTGRVLRSLSVAKSAVRGAALSPDGRWLATTGLGGTRLWEVATGKQVREFSLYEAQKHGKKVGLPVHGELASNVLFSPDGRLLATAELGSLNIWDVSTGDLVQQLPFWPFSIAFSRDGLWLAAGGENQVKVFEVATGQALRSEPTGTNPSPTGIAAARVDVVAFSPDNRWLASGNGDGTIKIWEALSGREARVLTRAGSAIMGLAFGPDGKWLASGGPSGVQLWSIDSGVEIPGPWGKNLPVVALAISPDGHRLGIAGMVDVVFLDVPERERGGALRSDHLIGSSAIALSQDGRWLALGSTEKSIQLWDLAAGGQVRTLAGHTGPVLALAFSPDGRSLASASSDNTVKVWDVMTGQERRALTGHAAAVRSVAFDPDGRLLASASEDKEVKIWDLNEGKEQRTLSGLSEVYIRTDALNGFSGKIAGAWAVAFSPDGKLVAAAGAGGVRLWDVISGNEVRTFLGESGRDFVYTSAAFSPDGCYISGAFSHAISVWDVKTGRELWSKAGGFGGPNVKAFSFFSRDGSRLATSGTGGEIRIVNAATGQDLLGIGSQGFPLTMPC